MMPFLKSVSTCEVSSRNKQYLHLGQKFVSLGIFRLEFKKAIVIFEINALEIV